MEAWQATAQDEAGNVIFNPTVTVYESDGVTLASIFNEDGSPKPNPFVGGIEGFCQFWAGPGTYKIRGVSGGQTDLWENDLGLAKEALETTRLYFNSIAELKSDTSLGYSAGHVVSIDDLVSIRDDGTILRVQGAGNARPHMTTAGGVKLAVVKWGGSNKGALAQIGSRCQSGEDVRIACYGDSTTLGVDGVTETFNNWPNRLGSNLRSMTGNDSVATYNCGSGGKQVIDWWAFDNYQSTVIGPNPLSEYVFLQFGLNDIRIGNTPGWDRELFKSRYIHTINLIRASGRIPVLVTPITISAAPGRPVGNIQGDLLNCHYELAEELQIDLLDYNKCMQDWQANRTDQYRIGDYQTDGTHPSDDVYVALAGFAAKKILPGIVVDVKNGSRVGPNNAIWSPDVTVAYNYNMNNAWGFSARLTAASSVGAAASIWVWSDRARKGIYVSPDRSVVSGSGTAAATIRKAGAPAPSATTISFGNAGSSTTERPAENHIYIGELPFGLSLLRFDCGGAGTFEFGGWIVVDEFAPVSVSAYSVNTVDRQLFLPDFSDSRPEVVIARGSSTSFALMGDVPVGWGVVIGYQYVYADGADTGPSRRMQAIVALRTSTGCQIHRVLSGASGVFSATDITTSGSGAWVGQITFHATTDGSDNAQIQVRANGSIIAAHTNSGSDPFMSPYGRLGGLYRNPALVTDPDGRVACATVVPMPY